MGSANTSRSATPTEGVSKKRPRSETPADNAINSTKENTSGDSDENKKNSITNGLKKKKKAAEPPPSSSSSTLRFEEEIAMASSEATIRLLKSSLQRLTDGIPKRELKLIMLEAKACEAALEDELRILRQGLELERQKKQATTSNNSSENGKDSGKDADASDKKSKHGTPTTTSSSSPLTPAETTSLQTMLDSDFTPTDTHWTLSALLGRLRHELTTPLPPRSQLPIHREKQGLTQLAQNVGLTSQSTYKKRGPRPASATPATAPTTNYMSNSSEDNATTETTPLGSDEPTKATTTTATTETAKTPNDSQALLSEASQFKRLESLPEHAEYRREHAIPDKLLAVWKKLSTHRSSLVFRRPVNPKEAPGYTDRIRFPMDLSLIRKLILSKHIKNYEGILKQVHLIGHNCVKYNGRESDYALVTREFESVATEYIWNAIMKDTYGGARGRWSRNTSPMPPSSSSNNLAANAAPSNTTSSSSATNPVESTPAASQTATAENPNKT